MKKTILVLAAALFLGGCAVYAEPPVTRLYVPGPPPVYVAPPPVVVTPIRLGDGATLTAGGTDLHIAAPGVDTTRSGRLPPTVVSASCVTPQGRSTRRARMALRHWPRR